MKVLLQRLWTDPAVFLAAIAALGSAGLAAAAVISAGGSTILAVSAALGALGIGGGAVHGRSGRDFGHRGGQAMSDAELPDGFGAIVGPLREEMPDRYDVETVEAVGEASVEAAAVAAYYTTLIESEIPERTAARLARDYATERAWRVCGDDA